MTSSIIPNHNFTLITNRLCLNSIVCYHKHSPALCGKLSGANTARLKCLVPYAKKRNNRHKKNKPWWRRFFFEDDGNWLGLREDDMAEGVVEGNEGGEEGEELSEGEKFEAWRRRAEAIVELREAQVDVRNEEGRMWEDWVVDEGGEYSWSDGGGKEGGFDNGRLMDGGDGDEKGIVETVSDMILGRREEEEDGDVLYEDRVFRYASVNSVRKFCCPLLVLKLLIVMSSLFSAFFAVMQYLMVNILNIVAGGTCCRISL